MKANKLLNRILMQVKLDSEVEKMNYKELGDFLIYNYPKNFKFGTKECAVLDRVINILQGEENNAIH